MKLAVAAVLSVALSSVALAADPVVVTPPAAAPAPAAASKFTVDTPLETIVADTAGKAVLDATMPGITTHAMYEQFKSMSLKQLAPMSGGKITDEGLAKVSAALAAVK